MLLELVATGGSGNLPLVISAGVAVFVAFTGPPFAIWTANQSRQQDREAEWAHQEEENKSAVLAEANKVGITVDEKGTAAEIRATLNKALLDNVADVKEKVADVKDAVDVVHKFVNSDRLASVMRELASSKRELVMLKTIMRQGTELGHDPDVEALGLIRATEDHIADLTLEVEQREIGAQQAADHLKARPGGEVDS